MRVIVEALAAGRAGFLEQRRAAREMSRIANVCGLPHITRDPAWVALEAGMLPAALQPGAALGLSELRTRILKDDNRGN